MRSKNRANILAWFLLAAGKAASGRSARRQPGQVPASLACVRASGRSKSCALLRPRCEILCDFALDTTACIVDDDDYQLWQTRQYSKQHLALAQSHVPSAEARAGICAHMRLCTAHGPTGKTGSRDCRSVAGANTGNGATLAQHMQTPTKAPAKPHDPSDWGDDEVQRPLSDTERAVDEVKREVSVRERCYSRWVDEGRMSRTEAKERMFGMKKALEILQNLLDSEASAQS